MVKDLLLGDNPFIGVSHLAQEKAREEQKELSLENKVEVIGAAIKGGATGFTFSTHNANLSLLKYLRNKYPEISCRLNYYILMPYSTQYVRKAASSGTAQLIKEIFLEKISLGNLMMAIPPKPTNFIKIFLEAELKEYLSVLPKNMVKAVLLHEVLTEMILAFNLSNIVRALSEHFARKGIGFGLETRNIKHLNEFLENNDITLEYLMTPINPVGYQMTLSKSEAEEVINELSEKNVKIIAINALASGTVTPEEAVNYLNRFRDNIFAVAVGTSKSWRALETFTQLSKLK